MPYMTIEHDNYTVEFDTPEVYVDNQARRRSGHMSHALAEFAPNCFIDFNSNCSHDRRGGHSAFGFVEYRISRDGGKTYSDIRILPCSMDALLDGRWTISAEKAVACSDGSIVLFLLRNTTLTEGCCEPWLTPMYIRSTDQGQTWSEAKELSPDRGRVYDALYRDGVIYALEFGTLVLGVTARRIEAAMSETGGNIYLEYVVELERQPLGLNTYDLRVKADA